MTGGGLTDAMEKSKFTESADRVCVAAGREQCHGRVRASAASSASVKPRSTAGRRERAETDRGGPDDGHVFGRQMN